MEVSRKTKIWILIAILSVAGAPLIYFFGMRLYEDYKIVFLVLIPVLAAIFIFSLFDLISGKSRRNKEINGTEVSLDVE